jgi:hypothetical protein
MKRLTFLTIAILLLAISVFSFAQNPTTAISNTLKTGNTSALSEYFASSLDLTLLDEEDTYNKAQARTLINNFFKENTAQGFSIKHQGSADNDAKYIIGILNTSSGKFRTYLVIREGKIHEISIEE